MNNHEHRRFLYDGKGVIVGYQCAVTNPKSKDGICGDLIRTAVGFNRHLFRKHGINKQQSLFKEEDISHVNLDCYEPEINAA